MKRLTRGLVRANIRTCTRSQLRFYQTIKQLNHNRLTYVGEEQVWKNEKTVSSRPATVMMMGKIRHNDSLKALALMTHYCLKEYDLNVLVESHVYDQLVSTVKSNVPDENVTFDQIYTFDASVREELDKLKRTVDFIICIGGDGTIIYLHSLFPDIEMPPALPFVVDGSLGFLLHHDLELYQESIDKVMNNQFDCTRRMRLTANIIRNGVSVKTQTLLNELCIHRGSAPNPVIVKSFIDNSYFTTSRGDGIIVSTPTGSTGYNLSASGPMIHPKVDCIAVTPVCPNIPLSMRPVVIPANLQCRLEVLNREAVVMFDSFDKFDLLPGDQIVVTKSPYPCLTFDSASGMTPDWMHSVRKRLEFNYKHEL